MLSGAVSRWGLGLAGALAALLPWGARAASPSVSAAPQVTFETCNRLPPAARAASRFVSVARADDLPDFIITDVQGPARVHGAMPYQVDVTVCNVGRREARAGVTLFASRDPCYSHDDALLESAQIGPLAAGACVSLPVPVRGDLVRTNTWFVGALVASESRVLESSEENNVHDGVPVTFDPPPDFVVELVDVPAVVRPDEDFSATARVCNRGMGPGAAQVGLYQSADPHVDTEDARLNWHFGLYLEPGACEVTRLNGRVGQTGQWHLAFITATAHGRPEEDVTNNVSAVSNLMVGTVPDYFIASLKAPPVESGNGPLPVRLTVCNQGTAPALASWVRFQLQSLEAAAEGVLRVASRDIPALAAGQCVEWDEPLGSAENAAGRWRLTATVNPEGAQPEAHAGNNSRSHELRLGNWVELGVARVVPVTHALVPGASFTTEVKVCNTGSVPAQRLAIHVALSDDQDARTGVRVGTRTFDALGKGCVVLPVQGAVPSEGLTGNVYVKALVELISPQGGELNVADNALVGPEVGIGSGPDLVVTRVQAAAPVASVDGWLGVSVTVCNKGNQAAPGVPVWVSFLPEPNTHGLPLLVGSWLTVAPLAPGACTTLDAEPWAPPQEGAWRPTAWVDESNTIPEVVESNNFVRGEVFQVTRQTGLLITGVQAPTALLANTGFMSTVTVCNRSPQPQPPTRLGLSLRTEDDFPVAEFYSVGTRYDLASGACEEVMALGSTDVAREGPYRLVAQLGYPWAASTEAEWKALSFAVPIGVGQGSDFAITSVSAPSSVRRGSAFTTTVAVCNRGNSGGSAMLTTYLSRDEHIEMPGDVGVGQVSVSLGPGACRTWEVRSIANVSAGDVWYVGAHVRAGSTPDLVVANDSRVGARVLVTP